jgi:hypothetical protein
MTAAAGRPLRRGDEFAGAERLTAVGANQFNDETARK